MFRTLLTTTAMVAILQSGALAQDTNAQDPAAPPPPETTAEQPADGTGMDASGSAAATDDQNASGGTQTAASGDNDPGDGSGFYAATQNQILVNKLIGKSVYDGEGEEAESIGNVNDIVLSEEGEAEAVIIGVGGFLGIGEKDVAVNFDRLRWLGEQNNERVVIETSREQLEAAPAFDTAAMTTVDESQQEQDTAAMDPAATGTADGTDDTAMAPGTPATEEQPADQETAAAPDEQPADQETAAAPDEQPADQETAAATDQSQDEMTTGAISGDAESQADFDRNSMEQAGLDTLSADDLTGARVYNEQNESIGEVSDILLTEDGMVEAFVLDVGGFLGIGEKSVAVKAENIDFRRDEDGNLMVFTPFTEDQLEQQATYDEDAYRSGTEGSALEAPRS